MTRAAHRRVNLALPRHAGRFAFALGVALAISIGAFGLRSALAGDDAYRPPSDAMSGSSGDDSYQGSSQGDDSYQPNGRSYPAPRASRSYDSQSGDGSGSQSADYGAYRGGSGSGRGDAGGYGEPYSPPQGSASRDERYEPGPPPDGPGSGPPPNNSYTQDEIVRAGHSFFGKVTGGLAEAIEWAFHKAGRPNGYILGQDAGGAIVAGLRYGEGTLYTKDAGNHKVYWQGPSVGYDFGGEGSKVMTLVYNLRDPNEIYERFGGVQGAAYLVGGISVQFEKAGHVTLAPIRAGVGLRLGANVGYLKYTRSPTWNPF